MFSKQFHLEENKFSSHEEWKQQWKEKRNDSFFLVGSKDETSGNQSCQLIKKNDTLSLHVRLPNAFDKKVLLIKDLNFAYGQEEILQALYENELRKEAQKQKHPYSHLGKAINFLFKKDEKGWRVFVTIEKSRPAIKSKKSLGLIGLDINTNHIALAETDHYGNLIDKKTYAFNLYGKSKNQTKALLGEISKQIVFKALTAKKPLVIENLNFAKKKQQLREQSNKYARMLSSFSYNQIISSIESKAFKEGIEVNKVNPAYTSIIGRIKYQIRYGLSSHLSAAFTIARRRNYYSEKLPGHLKIIDIKSSKTAFFLPERNRKKHVWSDYRKIIKKLKTANVLHVSTIIRSSRPNKLLCDSDSWGAQVR